MLELRNITKRFPGILANDEVSLTVHPGEVIGLLGENGAGKSTLMNLVSGLLVPDDGQILIDGVSVEFRTPADAVFAGIGMVHQHFKLVPTLSVTENVVLGDTRSNPLLSRIGMQEASVAAIGDRIGLPVDPTARVGDLDVGAQQRVEIIKALYRDARILILDEPTTVLTDEERERLFETIRHLTKAGAAVILVSHKLDDIFSVCQRVMVLRDGRVVRQSAIEDCSPEGLVESMVGSSVTLPDHHAARPTSADRLVHARCLSARGDNGAMAFDDITFDLRGGEILALAGVEGNGQHELSEVLAGLRPATRGELTYDALDVKPGFRPKSLRKAGLRHIPADRHASALLLSRTLVENQMLTKLFGGHYVRNGMLHRSGARADTQSVIERYDVRAGSADVEIQTLSGGNQQKLVLGREVDDGARLLIAVHPTRGLDIRTVAFVRETLAEKRDQGLGILLVSTDLEEIWQIADRIMVLSGGRLHGPKPLSETSLPEVGGWMTER